VRNQSKFRISEVITVLIESGRLHQNRIPTQRDVLLRKN
jgi:hypothetical protein